MASQNVFDRNATGKDIFKHAMRFNFSQLDHVYVVRGYSRARLVSEVLALGHTSNPTRTGKSLRISYQLFQEALL